MSPDEAQRAHGLGLIFSVPTALVFLLMASVSDSMNNAFLVLAFIAFLLSLPWSIVALVLFLFAVPMNSGLHSNMDGYSWRVVLAYSAPVITVIGAHLNGFLIGKRIFRNRSA